MESSKFTIERKVPDLVVGRELTPEQGVSEMRAFLERMRQEYPTHNYVGSLIIDSYDPAKKDKIPIVFSAKVRDKTVGVLMGVEERGGLYLHFLLVDPIFRNTELTQRLFEKAQSTSEHIRLNPFGLQTKYRDPEKGSHIRTDAVSRYYKRFGFEQNEIGGMTWNREPSDI